MKDYAYLAMFVCMNTYISVTIRARATKFYDNVYFFSVKILSYIT